MCEDSCFDSFLARYLPSKNLNDFIFLERT
jgi:hypothetical protein